MERTSMENFLDRLTQKLTVQEPAKNITAQQARDNARLQEKVKEYQECLVQLKKAQEALTQAAQAAKQAMDDTQITALLEANVTQVEQLKNDASLHLEKLQQESASTLRQLAQDVMGRLEKNQKEADQLSGILEERFAGAEEYIHKENVKVYRNVQAVVENQTAKGTEEILDSIGSQEGKLGVVMGLSIASLVVSLAGLAVILLKTFVL